MRRMKKIGSAVVFAAVIAGGMTIGTARVEAKKGGVDPQAAFCSYLASVIKYPYTSDAIKSYALYLFNAYNCDPALLN